MIEFTNDSGQTKEFIGYTVKCVGIYVDNGFAVLDPPIYSESGINFSKYNKDKSKPPIYFKSIKLAQKWLKDFIKINELPFSYDDPDYEIIPVWNNLVFSKKELPKNHWYIYANNFGAVYKDYRLQNAFDFIPNSVDLQYHLIPFDSKEEAEQWIVNRNNHYNWPEKHKCKYQVISEADLKKIKRQ